MTRNTDKWITYILFEQIAEFEQISVLILIAPSPVLEHGGERARDSDL